MSTPATAPSGISLLGVVQEFFRELARVLLGSEILLIEHQVPIHVGHLGHQAQHLRTEGHVGRQRLLLGHANITAVDVDAASGQQPCDMNA